MYQKQHGFLALNRLPYKALVRDAFIRMTSELPKVPADIRSLMYDVARPEEERYPNLLGPYERAAIGCARYGAPFSSVVKPEREFEAFLKAFFYRETLPSISEANQMEQTANGSLDPLQLRLEKHHDLETVQAARCALEKQIAHSKTLLAVLDQYTHEPSLKLEK